MCCGLGAVGRIARRAMALRRRSTTGSTGEPSRPLGRICATLAAQAELPDELSIDSTALRAHRSAHGGTRRSASAKRGAKIQAIGLSLGGQTTKIHALTDGCGRAVAFTLSPGNHADISEAPALLDKCPAPKRLLADKGHDANSLRDRLAADKAEAVIPLPDRERRPSPPMLRPIASATGSSAPFAD